MMLAIMVIYGVVMTAVAWYAIAGWAKANRTSESLFRSAEDLRALNEILINGERNDNR
jgi:hypothetical protein